MKRSFLFLQGVCSPFFARLADALRAQGHRVHKVNFTGGDVAYWLPRPATAFRGQLSELPVFLEQLWQQHGITDQIVFGDCRPIHKIAIQHSDAFDIRNHVFEEGYFRPFWITLEREGVNGHSLLPRDPDWFRYVGARLPAPTAPKRFRSPFLFRAAHDVLYHLASASNPLIFRHYQSHSPYSAPQEYAGYCTRFLKLKTRKNRDKLAIEKLLTKKTDFYILPLQLSSDAQIRSHSQFDNMLEVIEFVMQSFAQHAPRDSLLVIKNHPLDAGLIAYQNIINRYTQDFMLHGRIVYLESGDLQPLLKKALGTVTVNSTVGGLALELNCPTIALSDPIYNLPNLTFQGDLHDFWHNAQPPETALYQCYRNTVMHATQLNGGFYCAQPIALAVHAAQQILTTEQSPLEKLLAW